MSKLNEKKENLTNAIKRLNEVNIRYKKNKEDDVYQDALIQRFEFTFELAWKTMMEWLNDEGVFVFAATPRSVLKAGFESGVLKNETIWLAMLTSRNALAHEYDASFAKLTAEKISNVYCKELTGLTKMLNN